MELIDLKYCINAKNENTELDEPCDCYRYYIDVAYNFNAYRISFCKHWKDYLFNKNASSIVGRNYSHKSLNEEVLFTILTKACIIVDKPLIYYDNNKPPTFEDIKIGNIYFDEPVYVVDREYYCTKMFINRIKAVDVYRKIIELYEYDINKNPEFILNNYGCLNPFAEIYSSSNILKQYYKHLDAFRNKIIEVNKKVAGRAKSSIADELQNLIKLTIKEKRV